NCRDGTRVVALLTDADAPLTRPELRTYKIEYTIVKESSDVVELDFTAHCDPLVTLRLHAPRRDVLDDCLRSEGFREVRWGGLPRIPGRTGTIRRRLLGLLPGNDAVDNLHGDHLALNASTCTTTDNPIETRYLLDQAR
uniref:hypothetical protein n=1 Tax=Pseudonocardia sp. ICBG1293 TaxID=2844382 RepID=UPI001CCF5E0F